MIEWFTADVVWLIAGALFITFEAFAVPGIGFLFAGLAAICTGALIIFGVIDADGYLYQGITFFAFTVISAVVLWRPMQRYHYVHPSKAYNNIIGSLARVDGEMLRAKSFGKVRWSGTVMSARIDERCDIEEVAVGEDVKITRMHGTILYVAPVDTDIPIEETASEESEK